MTDLEPGKPLWCAILTTPPNMLKEHFFLDKIEDNFYLGHFGGGFPIGLPMSQYILAGSYACLVKKLKDCVKDKINAHKYDISVLETYLKELK